MEAKKEFQVLLLMLMILMDMALKYFHTYLQSLVLTEWQLMLT